MQIKAIRGYTTNPQLSWAVDNTIGGSYSNTLNGATTFIASNRAHASMSGASVSKVYYRHILVFDSTKTTLKQLLPVTSRNSIIMKKSPTDVVTAVDMYPIDRAAKTFAIGGETTAGVLATTIHPVDAGCDYPMLIQNPGDCYVGFVNGVNPGPSNAAGVVPDGSIGRNIEPCDPQFAHSLDGAEIVHAANCEKSKAHIQLVDANSDPVGNLQLPRGASIKFRKKATDKVYASETLSGGGNFANCNVVFSKIGYSN